VVASGCGGPDTRYPARGTVRLLVQLERPSSPLKRRSDGYSISSRAGAHMYIAFLAYLLYVALD
jgi:hypothetical protein